MTVNYQHIKPHISLAATRPTLRELDLTHLLSMSSRGEEEREETTANARGGHLVICEQAIGVVSIQFSTGSSEKNMIYSTLFQLSYCYECVQFCVTSAASRAAKSNCTVSYL